MPFARPTLKDIRDRTLADIKSKFGIVSTILRRALLRDFSDAMAAGFHANHGHIDWATKQLFTATAETDYLDLHGADYGLARKVSTFASGSVDFSGTDSTQIPAGTVVQRADGVQYSTNAAATIAAGVATVAVTAEVAGADGNADAGTALTLVSPIAGIDSAASVEAAGISGGADTEDDDDYRARIQQRKRNTPQGGSVSDFERWTLEVAGVTRAFIAKNGMGPGTTVVRFVLDDDPVSIIPDAAKIQEVQDYLEDDSRRGTTGDIYVLAPVEVPVDLTIALTPNTATVQAAVAAEITDLFRREAVPGATLLLSHIDEAISTAAGEEDHELVSPIADITLGAGDLAVLGTITWQ